MVLQIRESEDLKIHENHNQIKNHSAALNVTPNLQILLIKRHMKISTKMKDHSAAVNETQNQQTPLKIHLKIHENQDQNENHSAALIHKE